MWPISALMLAFLAYSRAGSHCRRHALPVWELYRLCGELDLTRSAVHA